MVRARQAIKLANECFRAIEEKPYTPPVCKPYSGMICIHLRYLPSCEGCPIIKHKLKEGGKTNEPYIKNAS